ncbi:endoglucanase-4 [Verticillium dahliae]|nr:endoglucanase-4 [Verticillium dahliae]
MRSFSALLASPACLPELVSAHGFVRGIRAGGVWTAGSDPTLDLSSLRAFGTNDIACHKSATAGKNFVNVNAGQTIEIYWNTWPASHKGPIIDYIDPYNGGDHCWQPEVVQVRPEDASSAARRGSPTASFANNFTTTTTSPPQPGAGQLRPAHEIIALHGAGNDNGAQNYPQCLNLKVSGSGTVRPTNGVAGTSLYTRNQPGIIFNLYTSYTSYPYPGPALWTAAN